MVRSQLIFLLIANAALASAQANPKPSESLLAPHGLQNFSPLYRQAVDALFTAYPAYQRGDLAGASQILDSFWQKHPAGSQEWAAAQGEGEQVARKVGVEFGDPPCYYALRMLTECVAWRLHSASEPARIAPLRFTVALLGHSHGIEPASIEEMHEQRGQMVRNNLDPRFVEAPGPIIDDCFGLLFDYIHAFTGGRITVHTNIVQLPNLDPAMRVFDNPGDPRAELAPGALERIWGALDPELKATTDWWYLLYPSHRPDLSEAFAGIDFSNGGGTTRAPGTNAMLMLGDERVLVTRAPKYRGGMVTREERFAFFSSVMQHEFFHELFWLYPEFKLEARGHQWFDRKSWPGDFVGVNESDYYAEALHKRLLALGNPPVWAKIRYGVPAEVATKITAADLVGAFRRNPVTNDWHEGSIAVDPIVPGLRWTNNAKRSWHLELTPDHRRLLTGPDNPYFQNALGHEFRVAFKQDENGEFLPAVAGFWFNGELYSKLPEAH